MKTIVIRSIAVILDIALGLAIWYVHSLFEGPDYLRLPAHYPFKSEAARKQYYEYYEERAKEWPEPSEARYVETAFGRTFVRTSGAQGAPPLVLLPSGFASSLIWLPNTAGACWITG